MDTLPKIYLIADTRERLVTENTAAFDSITLKIKQITVGDYVVCSGWNIITVIERKSLVDYAASIKDGRSANKEKLLKLRAECNCNIIYIIEGPEFPAQETLYGRIPYKHIESSIFHLLARDNIAILRAKNPLETARLLCRYVHSMDTLQNKHDFARVSSIENILGDGEVLDIPESISARLTLREGRTLHSVVEQVWACVPGISMDSAHCFMRGNTLRSLLTGTVVLTGLKVNGRNVSTRVLKAVADLTPHYSAMLTAIPGISKKTAAELSMKKILESDVATLACMLVGPRKLGPAKAKYIMEVLDYQGPVANPAPEAQEADSSTAPGNVSI